MTDPRPRPSFAHASEAELARILDFYDVRWEYEPHVFPIRFDRSGSVLESFSPDFYLPDLELYVELTTLKQRLVRKKNRKLRRVRALYPQTRIKLLYAKDFRALMLKYGKLALVDALSGTEGQATPPRSRSAPVEVHPPGSPARPVAIPAPTTIPEPDAPRAPVATPTPTPARAAGAAAQRSGRRTRRTRAEARARALARALTARPAANASFPEAER